MKSVGLKKYFTNTSWLMAESIIHIMVSLFVGVWIARYLGPEKFGLLSYAQVFVAIIVIIVPLGLDSIVVRELVKNEYNRDVLLGTTFGLRIIGTFTAFVLIGFFVQFTSNDSFTNLLILIIASGSIFSAVTSIDLYFQSKVISKYIVYSNMAALTLTTIIKIVFIVTSAGLVAFAVVAIIDKFIIAIGRIYYYRKQGLELLKWKFDIRLASTLLSDSWPLIMSGIVIIIYMKIDQVMIKEMLDSRAVGQYAAAVKLSEAFYFIPAVITASLFPAIINAKNLSEVIYKQRMRYLYSLLLWLAIPMAVFLSYTGDFLISLLFGREYDESGSILMIHAWAGIFVFVGLANRQWLINENLQKIFMINTTLGAVINIILNYVLIEIYGIQGAAIATVFSYAFASYLGLLMFKRTRYSFVEITRSINILYIFRRLNSNNINYYLK